MIQFIDEHRDRFLSRVHLPDVEEQSRRRLHYLSWVPPIQSSRAEVPRSLRDAALLEHISTVHSANYGVYGVRKMWHALRRDGIDTGREQTARVMRLAGVTGKGERPVCCDDSQAQRSGSASRPSQARLQGSATAQVVGS